MRRFRVSSRCLRGCFAPWLVLGGALLFVPASTAKADRPKLTFSVFAHTSENMDSIVWTGKQFLYVQNTKNAVFSAPAGGLPIHTFSTMPELTEETRCVFSTGTHGWPSDTVFCHSPDDKIYEIPGAGGPATVFATLPVPSGTVSDGALAWDDVGHFGYRLVAATGRSGAGQQPNGTVFTIDPTGAVQQVGGYQGPGVDEVAVAPAGFGAFAGDVLLAEDGGAVPSDILAMDATGKTRPVVRLAEGLNPVIPIPPVKQRSGLPRAGIYVTDDLSGDVFFAPAAQLARYAGDVLVGAENAPRFWVLVPHGQSVRALPVRHNALHSKSIEGGIFVP